MIIEHNELVEALENADKALKGSSLDQCYEIGLNLIDFVPALLSIVREHEEQAIRIKRYEDNDATIVRFQEKERSTGREYQKELRQHPDNGILSICPSLQRF